MIWKGKVFPKIHEWGKTDFFLHHNSGFGIMTRWKLSRSFRQLKKQIDRLIGELLVSQRFVRATAQTVQQFLGLDACKFGARAIDTVSLMNELLCCYLDVFSRTFFMFGCWMSSYGRYLSSESFLFIRDVFNFAQKLNLTAIKSKSLRRDNSRLMSKTITISKMH